MYDVERIGKMRKQLGLTQKELANLSGVSQSLIAKIESGKIDPAYSKVTQIISALESLQNKGRKTVADIMTSKIYSVSPKDSVAKAIKLMRGADISQLPVLEADKCLGSVSESIILDIVSGGKDLKSTKVEDIMKESFPVIPANSVVDVAMDLFRHYPAVLVDKNGKLAGIITKADMLKAI